MVHERGLVFFVAGLAVMVSCFGFIAECSANNPATWNAASSPETVAHTSGMKTEVTGADKVLQISDTKTSTETTEQTSPDATREKKFDFILENVENETNFAKIVKDARTNSAKDNSPTDSVTSAPRNVVLVIAETGQDSDDFWKNFKFSHSFPVDGLLQNCDNIDINAARFSLESALVSGNKDKKCDCERFLGSNIVALLLWARDAKGMTAASLSNANFTIPSLFEYEESVAIQRETDEPEENNMKLEIRKMKPDVHGDWHTADLGKPIHRASPLIPSSNNREDGADGTMWNVFDMFSKIRIALFHSLLESLGGNIPSPDDSIPSYNSYIRRSTLANMIGKLKSVESEKGFILAVTVPANELNSTVDLLQKEVSQETLLVVTGVCSKDNKLVPFFAHGPAAKTLRQANIIWDLPMTIGHAIASGCQGAGCRSHQHNSLPLPIPQLNIVPRSAAISMRTSRDTAVKSDHEAKKVADLDSKFIGNDSENFERKNLLLNRKSAELLPILAVKDNEKDSNQKIRRTNSMSNLTKAEMFTTIFGTLVSIFTVFALAS